MNALTKILIGIAVFIALSIIGNMDYYDAVLAEQHYAAMVCDGHWPDYKELNPECN
jgi:hypothetical protein